MSPVVPRITDPFASFSDPTADPTISQDDRDLNALERLFDRLKDEARSLRADARVLGVRIERLGRASSNWREG